MLPGVPLSQVAEVSTKLASPKICRRDRQRCITVKCDTMPGVLASSVVISKCNSSSAPGAKWPPGYHFQSGGEYEEQVKGFKAIGVALVVSMVLIYLALVLQFNSVVKPLVVFVGVPFGIVRDDGAATVRNALRIHGLSRGRFVGGRDCQPRHRAV